jgi:chemotaxis signal transduction protein
MAAKGSTRKKRLPKKSKKDISVSADVLTAPDHVDSGEDKIAVFQVGNEMYAFHVDKIIETLYSYKINPVDHLPDVFSGIVHYRGISLPVVSLRNLFHMEGPGSATPICIIVDMMQDQMGFIVDSDVDIVQERLGAKCALPDCYTPEEAKFIEGIFWIENKFIGVLNPCRMMEVLAGWRKGDGKK